MHSLYIHFPFCQSKCGYCSFFSITNKKYIEEYLDAICQELVWYAARYKKLKTIYLGGGTPSMMSGVQIEKLFSVINENFNYSKSIEISIECNPESINSEKLKIYSECGINRVSLGVQSFDDGVLKAIGRVHDSSVAVNAIKDIINSPINNFNCDIMFGLPGQTPEMLYGDLNRLVQFDIQHVSVYGLSLDETVPLYAKYKSGQYEMIDDDIYYDMYFDINNILKKHGFSKYEISNYSKKGYESKHNLSYWNYDEFIGVGCAAFGMLNGIRYNNMYDLDAYLKGSFDREEEVLSDKIMLSETIFMGLRKTEGIFFSEIFSRYGVDIKFLYEKELKELEQNGLIEINGDNCALTYKGMILSNEVFVKFI